MKKKQLSPALLRELLDYDPATGVFAWAEPTRSWFASDAHWSAYLASRSGKPPLSAEHSAGYLWGNVAGSQPLAHRVAWAYCYNEWPEAEIDHINHDRKDNRLLNLRGVSRIDNMRNASRSRSNTSGVTGVSWDADRKKWAARINLPGGRCVALGRYERIEDAVRARKAAEIRYGFHPNHGSDRVGGAE